MGALPLPVLSAVTHADEVAPHLHVLLLPLADGVHLGGKPVERPGVAAVPRESFFNVVAGPAGLQRESASCADRPNAGQLPPSWPAVRRWDCSPPMARYGRWR